MGFYSTGEWVWQLLQLFLIPINKFLSVQEGWFYSLQRLGYRHSNLSYCQSMELQHSSAFFFRRRLLSFSKCSMELQHSSAFFFRIRLDYRLLSLSYCSMELRGGSVSHRRRFCYQHFSHSYFTIQLQHSTGDGAITTHNITTVGACTRATKFDTISRVIRSIEGWVYNRRVRWWGLEVEKGWGMIPEESRRHDEVTLVTWNRHWNAYRGQCKFVSQLTTLWRMSRANS